MRDDFEFHGKGAFGVGTEHSQHGAVFYTDQMTVDALPRDSLERQAWKPTWQEEGWLLQNPLVSPILYAQDMLQLLLTTASLRHVLYT